jgi:hypothetical protein
VQVVTNGAHYDFAGVETNANLHLDAVGPAYLGTVAADSVLHGQGGVTGPHGVILMRHRRPE